ncbi:M protein, serotype 5 precursor, putative [Perkinsus marinus ATCC 50983]|uniref:M protein, serotype 5, putative n=1 Tax=Perkinsus marinus (strain ATCC 50983 / TXsc) TaxID=423536 RepID=C5KRX7_PERM5|nr:M protein, serotype 5 precursor, putative [Perkinsus marinus ATCC 50983]EER12818.1 M protein, serotype 5 precursor, putative [Perkinsus marinus ATCC 50983]|eukprot:XP_002781023.1 M protein, serotype 5 precursor, putative [Perkinsus marinus ATCC 50983]
MSTADTCVDASTMPSWLFRNFQLTSDTAIPPTCDPTEDGEAVTVGSIKLPVSGWTVDEVFKRLDNTEVYFYDILGVLEPPTRDLVREAIARATERLLMVISQLRAQLQEEGTVTPKTPEEIAASCLRELVSEHLVKWNVIVNTMLQLLPPGELEALTERLNVKQQHLAGPVSPAVVDEEASARLQQQVADLEGKLKEAESKLHNQEREFERQLAKWDTEKAALRASLAASRSSESAAGQHASLEMATLREDLEKSQEEAATLRAQLAAARKSQVQREQHDENIIRAKALEEHTARLEEEREALRCEYEGRIRELEEAFEARIKRLDEDREALQRELSTYHQQQQRVEEEKPARVRRDKSSQCPACGGKEALAFPYEASDRHKVEEVVLEERIQPTGEEERSISSPVPEMRDGVSQTEKRSEVVREKPRGHGKDRDEPDEAKESRFDMRTAFRDRTRRELVRPFKEEIFLLRKDNEEKALRMAVLQKKLESVQAQLADLVKSEDHNLTQQQKNTVARLLKASDFTSQGDDDDDLQNLLDGVDVPYRVLAEAAVHKSRRHMLYFDSKIRQARESARNAAKAKWSGKGDIICVAREPVFLPTLWISLQR